MKLDLDREIEEPVTCWECNGDGGWHDCGEDTCCCLEQEMNTICETCKGEGEL